MLIIGGTCRSNNQVSVPALGRTHICPKKKCPAVGAIGGSPINSALMVHSQEGASEDGNTVATVEVEEMEVDSGVHEMV